MNVRDPRLWLSLVSLGAVLGLLWIDLDATSPGPLTRTHAQDTGLASPTGCEGCHTEDDAPMAQACGECHAEILTQVHEQTGFHGQLDEELGPKCSACHLEHHGTDFKLVSARSFSLAGFARREDYDHPGLTLELSGRHDDLRCVECHTNADALVLHEGEERFLGLEKSCTSCHDDPHEGRIVRACEECHDQEGEFQIRGDYEHGEAFALDGAHAELGCLECHVSDSPHSVEVLAGSGALPPARACLDCHESPHGSPFMQAFGRNCETCHATRHEGFDDSRVTLDVPQHAETGFVLHPQHASLDCAECHAELGTFAERFPGRLSDDCAACHDDPHGDQFDSGTFASAGCLDCHEQHAFEPPAFGLEKHALTSFPLEGGHAAVGCFECHTRPNPDSMLEFADAPEQCSACHEDVHVAGPEWYGGEAGCEHCHQTSTFTDVQGFDHGASTDFQLEHAHAEVDCALCHVPGERSKDLGRRLGFATGKDCASCHADAHTGAFEANYGNDCSSCHTSESFRNRDPDFDHGAATGFVLAGAHAQADCETCHTRSARPDATGRRFGRVQALFGPETDRCDTCHTDVHDGRFRLDGILGSADCARCHTTDAFAHVPDFDHGAATGYNLSSAHAEASCEACHIPGAASSARGRRLGFAPGRQCATCHEEPHAGQFAQEGRTRCVDCHEVASSFSQLIFDHDRDSRYPLDERHEQLDCAACHRPWPLADGSQVVRYKPLGLECTDCHGPGGGF